jgi:integrase
VVNDPIGSIPLEKLGRGDLVKWLDRKQAEGLSATTCNRLRANISAVFTGLIEREEFRGDNPVRGVRQRKQKQAKNRKFDAAYVPALIEHAPTEGWQVAFALAAYAGMRRGEIERLTWADVDLDARMIFIEQTKTGVRRVVAIHAELAQILSDAKPSKKATGPVARAGWQKSAVVLRRALERAGIEPPSSVQSCFHSLRHVWATQMAECGADAFIVRFMGWGPPPGDVMASSYMKPRAALIEAIDHLRYPRSETSPEARHNLGTRGENGDE